MTFYTLNKSYFRQKINAFKRDALIIGKVVVLIRYFCSCSAIKYRFSDSCMKNQSKFILPLFTAQSPDYNWIISKISVNSTHPRWFSMMLSSFSRVFFPQNFMNRESWKWLSHDSNLLITLSKYHYSKSKNNSGNPEMANNQNISSHFARTMIFHNFSVLPPSDAAFACFSSRLRVRVRCPPAVLSKT